MLLVQLTDIHLMASPEQTLRGVNTQETLEKVLQAIANSDQKPDLFLLTGDLADAGDGEAYQRLRSAITPMGIPTYALMGNHDLRDHLCQHLINDLIHYQQQIILDNWQILCLDSTVAGQIGGHLSQETLNWLEQTLNTSQLPTLIALHHPLCYWNQHGSIAWVLPIGKTSGQCASVSPMSRWCCVVMPTSERICDKERLTVS